jgi:hypothetical protein
MAFSMVWHVTAKTSKKTTVWRKTRTANLYEHLQSGRYYAVAWVNGKQVFKSLKTDSADHAKIKLPTVLKEFGKMGRRKENVHPPETSFGRLSERYLESVRTSVKNKASTTHYREQTVKALFRSWPERQGGKTQRYHGRQLPGMGKAVFDHGNSPRSQPEYRPRDDNFTNPIQEHGRHIAAHLRGRNRWRTPIRKSGRKSVSKKPET